MTCLRVLRVSVLAGSLLIPAFAQQNARPQPRQLQQLRQPDNHPGEQIFDKLSRMSPEDRERALSQLPPAQRERIKERLQKFDELSPAAQNRQRDRLELLNSLPLQRQNQVRKSMKDLDLLPEDRKVAVRQELRRMEFMADDERRAHMNREEFRNRYSPAEQQMMSNLAAILPPGSE